MTQSLEASVFVGQSRATERLVGQIDSVAASRATVLVTGETGTGKGVVARRIHAQSDRSKLPFVHVDCAALSESVIESELFGHERGSFTGAHERRVGRFELADQGTVFLDEIGELPLGLQAKLLRVLQDREYERVGGSRTLGMRARVIAATNRRLEDAVRLGRFREDLYFRLNVVSISIPPLRLRLGDISALVAYRMARLAEELGRKPPLIDPSFIGCLMRHSWPGNVRELFNVLERVLVFNPADRLDASSLPMTWAGEDDLVPTGPPRETTLARPEEAPMLPQVEAGMIASALVETGGNIARAARRLSLPRSTLRYRIHYHRLQHLIPAD
jgi:transcriptional regulator with GAF, ATPase, and Fis domain